MSPTAPPPDDTPNNTQTGPGQQPVIPKDERTRMARDAKALEERIRAAKGPEPVPTGPEPGKAYGYVLRMAMDMVAGPLIGAFMGYWLDRWLGTAPFMLLLFIGFGLAASVRSATATYRQLQAQMSPPANGGPPASH